MKNQILITFESLRWDVFQSAEMPYLKSLGTWHKAYTPGTYTFPAHMSFFMGKLPQTLDGSDDYDPAPLRFQAPGRPVRARAFWQLTSPETVRPARYRADGENIIRGFEKKGYETIGTGAVSWFNSKMPAGKYLTEPFRQFKFFDGPDFSFHRSAGKQVAWLSDCLKRLRDKPYFLFANFGETHHPFKFGGCDWEQDATDPYGDSKQCFERQRRCAEHLDVKIMELLKPLSNFDLVICSDHGEAMGEEGLWGHGFCHPAVMQVPLLIRESVPDEA
ncbi:MAG: hypothetical protein A2Z83_00930 [Omnitrophica bacterium GWA2_52_8]|nr:MAG: hypothetical protein A2Z83_00930 [Omnitrophica bacterium GWA2_52_8]